MNKQKLYYMKKKNLSSYHYFKDKENLKILSFGCSTGLEIFSILEYMPNATIVGTDISEYNLKECEKYPKKENISFFHSLSNDFKKIKNFDAILCLAVFQHTINRHEDTQIATRYTFQQFERGILLLDEKLNSKGLLFVDQTDFNFLETSISHKYFPLPVAQNRIENNRPLFNSKNIKVSETNDCFRVF